MLSYLIVSFLAFAPQGAAKPPAQAPVKGQQQIAGGGGVFGTTYSLKNGFNFALLGGRYTLEPFDAYESLAAKTDQKLLVLDIAIKNAEPSDEFFNIDSMFTLVDDKGELYTGGALMLESKPKEPSFTLRPGQGLGQPSMKDPLHVGFTLPSAAKITKIMLNVGRRNTGEEAIRYLLVAPPKDAKTATNKNWLAPLPEAAREATDDFGAIAVEEGKAALKTPVVSGPFRLSVESIEAPADAAIGGNPPGDGKRYVVMTVAATSLIAHEQGMFDVEGGDEPLYALKDSDGEVYRPIGYGKPKSDDNPDHTFAKGEPYTFRVFFEVPKEAKITKATFGAGASRKWALDVSV